MPTITNSAPSRKTDLPIRTLRKTGTSIFVAIFLVELALFTTLACLNQEAETRALQEESRSDFMRIVFSMLESSALTWTSVVGHLSHGHDDGLKFSPQDYRLQSQKSFEEIRKVPFRSERSKLVTGQLQELVDNQAEAFDKLDQLGGTEHGISVLKYAGRYKIISHALARTKKIAAAINVSMEQELIEYLDGRQQEIRRREVFKWALCGVVALQLIFAYVLIALFFKGVTSRLNLLVDNARRLPMEADLPYTLSGSDELTHLDRALHETSKQLSQAASKRRAILSMVATDIRNPLTLALAQVEELIGEERGRSPASKLHNTLLVEKRLIDDLLHSEKIEAGALEMDAYRFDFNEVVADVLAVNEGVCARKNLNVRVDSAQIFVVADRNRIFQVVNNLVSNAAKFSFESGTIKISSIGTKRRLLVKIADTGCGFDPRDKEKIFERFYQSASSGQNSAGYGLGLSICKTIIQHHNGLIGVRTEEQKGSTFWFVLPLEANLGS